MEMALARLDRYVFIARHEIFGRCREEWKDDAQCNLRSVKSHIQPRPSNNACDDTRNDTITSSHQAAHPETEPPVWNALANDSPSKSAHKSCQDAGQQQYESKDNARSWRNRPQSML